MSQTGNFYSHNPGGSGRFSCRSVASRSVEKLSMAMIGVISVVIMRDVDLGLNISANLILKITKKVLMVIG